MEEKCRRLVEMPLEVLDPALAIVQVDGVHGL